MTAVLPLVIDVLLILALLGAVLRGARAGFVYTLGSTIGAVVGALAAVVLVPAIASWVPDPQWRIGAVFAAIALLVIGGLSLGEVIGHHWRRRVRKKLRSVDRVVGAVAGGTVGVLVVSLLAPTVTALGIPLVSPAVANSTVLSTIEKYTPDPVARALGQVRGLVVGEGIPRIADALGALDTGPPPTIDGGSAALTAAAQSVGRVTGAAYACGQTQSGSAFVIAEGRLLTNAHVVAGVTEPTVDMPGIGGIAGRVVYFDPQQDIAVIAIDGLSTAPLALGETLSSGTVAVQGYPYGGPFASTGAEIVEVRTIEAASIDGGSRAPRESYTLAADVNPGNSGGPVLDLDGAVIGMVYARSATRDDIGYAHTVRELDKVIAEAPELTDTVDSGRCTTR
ncbi:MAG: MarP family serine protease [Microcella sp.]|uniref:MarP family serine protease n=1 Tax=Microcella sp. TaxID=1913979 RepID=UPI0033155389